MFEDFTGLCLIADPFNPELTRPVYVESEGSFGPETIYCRIHMYSNTVHGAANLSIQEEILLYALLKATGLKLVDDINNQRRNCWPVITADDLISATASWRWRRQTIGDSLPELLQTMKAKQLVRICQDGNTLFFGLTKESVHLILKTAGYQVRPEMISY